MRINRKTLVWIVPLLVLLLLVGAGVRRAGLRLREARRQPAEMLAQVERGDLEVWVSGNGTVGAALEEEVRALVPGIIEASFLVEGREVTAGEKLVILKVPDLSLQIEMKEIDIAMRERELSRLKEEITTAADLKDQHQVEQMQHQTAMAELQLKQARLELTELKQRQQRNKEGTIIYAPISGILVFPEAPSGSPAPGGALRTTAGAGTEVAQGMLLAAVVDYTRLQVVIPVDELYINRVKEGQQVSLTAEALPGQKLSGQVAGVAPRGRISGGVAVFDVTVEIDPVEGLKVGMSISASILVDVRVGTLLVPIEAVFEEDGQSFLLAVGEEKEPGEVGSPRPVPVVTGLHDTSFIEILEGVTEGQAISIQGSTAWFGRQGGNPGGMFGRLPFGGGGR